MQKGNEPRAVSTRVYEGVAFTRARVSTPANPLNRGNAVFSAVLLVVAFAVALVYSALLCANLAFACDPEAGCDCCKQVDARCQCGEESCSEPSIETIASANTTSAAAPTDKDVNRPSDENVGLLLLGGEGIGDAEGPEDSEGSASTPEGGAEEPLDSVEKPSLYAILRTGWLYIGVEGGADVDVGPVGGDSAEGANAGEGSEDEGHPITLLGGNGSSGVPAAVEKYDLGDGCIAEGADAPWHEERDSIRYVSFGEGVRPLSMARWFTDLGKLERINFSGLDTSGVRDMRALFDMCTSLESVDVTGFKTSSVTSMERMFAGCSSVKSLDLGSFDTSSVTCMSGMFSGSSSLQSIDLSSFDTCNVADMRGMFSDCRSITALDLSSFNTQNVKQLDGMFDGCTSLAALDVSTFSADQLKSAKIPVDNKGGFWRMNVPDGYDAGIVLREPSAEERAAAGLPAADGEKVGDDDGEDADETESNKSGSPQQESRPNSSTGGDGSVAGNGAAFSTDVPSGAGGLLQGQRLLFSADSFAGDPAIVVGAAQDEDGQGGPMVVAGLMRAIVGGAVGAFSDAMTPFAKAALDQALDVGSVAEAAEAVLEVLGATAAVDKTMAMVAAALGMIAAAGLLLTLCFKIR